MEELTARQQRILDFIQATVRERGYPPTVREIGEAVGLTSSSSVHSQLANLERKGLLHRDPTKPRAIGVEAPRPDGVVVPLVGRVAAGPGTLAAEDVEDYLTVPVGFADGADHFALKVEGDSMILAGIFDGDTVVVRRQDAADTGDIVCVLLEGPAETEATIKRLRLDGDHATLVPENPSMEPFDLGEGRVVGRVVAVLRRL
jgi:repressor LexA